jgi:hypothetical protein
MKVIFLDIDGVLNSQEFLNKNKGASGFSAGRIDPELVARLNRIVQSTGAKIVISSTWRHGKSVWELKHMLRSRGFQYSSNIIDRTPIGMGIRGQEIQDWLELDPERERVDPNHDPVEAYVIIDDNNEMLPDQQDHMVHTNGQIGLTDEDVVEAISVLRLR